MKIRVLGVISALAVLSFTSSAFAQGICGSHADITDRLEGGYKEVVQGAGLSNNGGLVELYVSENGSWTFLFTRPNGLTCLVAAGQDWEAIKSQPILDEDEVL